MNAKLPDIAMTNNVYARLNDARSEFHTLKLKKSGHNKFAGYNYFELGDFLIPALEVFRKHNLSAVVSFTNELASMTIRCIDNPSDMIVITSPFSSAALKGCHEVQNVGAVETYQRRYLWVAALEIVEHDALDSSKPLDAEDTSKVKVSKITPMEAAKQDGDVQALKDDPEEMEFLRNLAAELVHMAETENDPDSAYEHAASVQLSNEEKLVLWELLAPNSKTRSAIKGKKKAA